MNGIILMSTETAKIEIEMRHNIELMMLANYSCL